MSVFEVDTKGTCLLCLNPNSTVVTINDCGDTSELTQSAVAFKMLLRYLNVDIMKMSHFSSSVKPNPSGWSDVNLSVSLCGDCSSVSTDFFELFQTLEGIRLQLNVCFSQLLQFMEKGAKDRDRIGEFERRIQAQRSVKDLIGVSIAEGLRKEVREKVVQKLKSGVPQISLQKLSSKLVDVNDQTVGNPIKGGPKMGALSRNKNIGTESKKISIDKSRSQISELKSAPPARISVNAKASDESKMDGSEGEYKSSIQPSSQVPESNKTWRKSASVLGNKLEGSKNEFECEMCRQYFSQKGNLRNHQLQRHMMTTLKDRLPSHISEKTLVSSLNAIVAKSKVISRQKFGRPVQECPFCNRPERYSLKVHLLKKHLDNVISKIEGTQQHDMTLSRTRPQTRDYNKRKTSNKPSTASSSLIKYSCNLCQRAFSTVLALKAHYRKTHLVPQSQSRWKCSDCERSFTIQSNLNVHRITAHPTSTFSKHIPPGVSDQNFHKALNRILGKSQKMVGRTSHSSGLVLVCPHCGKHVKQLIGMKLHITRRHLDKVLEAAGIGIISHNPTDNYLHQPMTKLEYIEIGEEANNGFAMEFESDVEDPLLM